MYLWSFYVSRLCVVVFSSYIIIFVVKVVIITSKDDIIVSVLINLLNQLYFG